MPGRDLRSVSASRIRSGANYPHGSVHCYKPPTIASKMPPISMCCFANEKQPLKMEWVIVLDNSGSMVRHEWSVCETLALVIEFLRKLECQFAVVRVGAMTPGSQKVRFQH